MLTLTLTLTLRVRVRVRVRLEFDDTKHTVRGYPSDFEHAK